MSERKEGVNRGNAGKGRPPGSPNKTTAIVKEAIHSALDQAGGDAYLLDVARTDKKAFCALLGRVMPAEIKAEHSGDLQLNVTIKRYGA